MLDLFRNPGNRFSYDTALIIVAAILGGSPLSTYVKEWRDIFGLIISIVNKNFLGKLFDYHSVGSD